MTLLILGLLVFLGAHAFVRFRGPREALAGSLGAQPYRGVFSLVSLAGFVLLIYGYGQYRAAGMIPVWTPPTFLSHISLILMLPVMVLLVSAYSPGKIKAMVVHPMLAAVKIWALAHLLANGDLGSMLLFGSFFAWALFARIRLGKAERVTMPMGRGDWIALGLGTAVWLGFMAGLHKILIGVPVIS
ncbi:hypothetical protein PbB2_01221 [Candidatus Phycosocius bacilliformis]|uniref:NnrU domain-containing protein n=1 Tax=Candidatus Phycosocius bacilliformis TaxID=1445552 RepID=A0A2P2E962_9PROT|nr:NnrU family protein [Candidatus Phycosocius bacilliformis]GBF57554.1 hypothetical protein PbB2_01221 [Candidatus Phycosocius bacilliformis]